MAAGEATSVIVTHMKIERKKEFTLGDLIVAAFQILGSESRRKDGAPGNQETPRGIARAGAFYGVSLKQEVSMKKASGRFDRMKIGLGVALLAALTGCVGYVDGGYGGGTVVVGAPDTFIFGGPFDRGRDVHDYSHRGAVSRAVAHGGGGGRKR